MSKYEHNSAAVYVRSILAVCSPFSVKNCDGVNECYAFIGQLN